MATLQENSKKFIQRLQKLDSGLGNIYSDINNSIDKQDSKVTIQRLIVKCKDAY